MVSIPSYRGPTNWHTDDGTPIVPIVSSVARWEPKDGRPCSRTQLPLRIAYAVTIHKSQGMTLDKVIIDLGLRDFCPELTFVACSRARSITDIAFRSQVTLSRLSNLGGLARVQEDFLRREGLGFQDGLTGEELGYNFN
jgi:hypothetical protein